MKKKSNKLGLALLLTIIVFSVSAIIVAFALDFTDPNSNNVEWHFTPLNGKITVDGVEYATAKIDKAIISEQTTEFAIPSSLTDASGNVYYITEIADNAFANNKKVFGNLTLPEHLTKIGNGAFSGTYIYGTVTIPEGVKDTVDANGKITAGIGANAFASCVGIKEVVLPSEVTYLQTSVFEGCFALSKVNTENITVFGKSCFKNCRALLNVTISDKTIAIMANAFESCDSFDGIFDLSFIGQNGSINVLLNQKDYKKSELLATDSFKNCIRIEGFIIPNDNECANFAAFNGCSMLQGYYVDQNPNYYPFEKSDSLYGILCTYNKGSEGVWDGTLTIDRFPLTRKAPVLEIDDKVTQIKANAFSGSKNLEEVILGSSMTSISKDAFSGSSIKFVYVPDNIKTIEFNAFKGCTKLETVILSQGVELVAADAFSGATALKLIIAGNDVISPIACNGKFYHSSEYHCSEHMYGYLDMPPTCEESGYFKCIACHRYEYAAATGHTGAIINEKKVTCVDDGTITVMCMDCDYQEFEIITDKALGHVSNGTYFTVYPDHMSPSLTYSVCTECNNFYISEYKTCFNQTGDINQDSRIDYYDYAALEKYIADKSSVTEFSKANADINKDGYADEDDLSILLSFLSGKIDALPNQLAFECADHEENVNAVTYNVIAASCKSKGFKITYCADCGCLLSEKTVKQLKHELTEINTVAPSCAKEGQTISLCSLCNEKIYEPIEKLQHTHNWYATASSRGFEYSTCEVCGVFEYRTVDYSEFESLFGMVQMKCTCTPTCSNLLNDKIKQHVNAAYYTADFALEVKKYADKFLVAMTQADVDIAVAELYALLANPQYKVNNVPSIFLSFAPASQYDYYDPTSIIVASKDDDNVVWLEAFDQNASIKVRGRGSSGHSQKSYNIKFSTEVDLLGLGKSKKYCLLSLGNTNDDTHIRNALTFELSELFGIDYSCKYEIVNIFVGGTLSGAYLLTTAVEIGENRVDIDEETDYLLEIEYQHLDKDLKKSVSVKSPIYQMQFLVNEPEIEDLTGAALSKMYTYVMEIDFAIQSGDWARIQRYIDVESVAKYYVLHDYLKEVDIVWDSTRFYIKEEAILDDEGNVVDVVPRLHGGPAWDFDYSMFWEQGIIKGGSSENVASYYYNNSSYRCLGEIINGQSNVVVNDTSTGEWASLEWKYNEDGRYRLFFCPLYLNSKEFVMLVCQTFADLNDEMKLLYEDELDSKGNVVRQNIIDSIVLDEDISAAVSMQNIEKLRAWLKKRNEWVQANYAAKLERLSK